MAKNRGGGVVYPIDWLHARTAARLDESSRSFPMRIGGLDKRNRPISGTNGLEFGGIMTQVRQGGSGRGRGFASELGTPVEERLSYPYQRLPLSQPRGENTHSYEFLASYRSGGGAVLGLLHLVDFGDGESPGDVDAVPNQAIVFDWATGTVKWLKQDGDQPVVHELGNDDMDTMVGLYEGFIATELSELDTTPVYVKEFRYQRTRRVGAAARTVAGVGFEFTKVLIGRDSGTGGRSAYGQTGQSGQQGMGS